MTQIGVCPLVCLFSIWPGQGFYVEIFLINAFPRLQQWKWKKVFSWCFQCKDIKLAALLHNFRGHKNVNQFIHFQIHQFYLNYVGERRGFLWPLVIYIWTSQPPVTHLTLTFKFFLGEKNEYSCSFFHGNIFSGREHLWKSLFLYPRPLWPQWETHQSIKARRKNFGL